MSVYCGMCLYALHRECDGKLVECVGMFYIVSVMGSSWNVSVHSGMCRYIAECVGVCYIVSVTECLWTVLVYCGMCRYVLHRECGGELVECVGVLWDVSVCFTS